MKIKVMGDIKHVGFDQPNKTRKILVYVPFLEEGSSTRFIVQAVRYLKTIPDFEVKVLSQDRDESGHPVSWPEDTLIKIHAADFPVGVNLINFLVSAQPAFIQRLNAEAEKMDLVWCPVPWFIFGNLVPNIRCPIIFDIPSMPFDQIPMGQVGDYLSKQVSMISSVSSKIVFHSFVQLENGIRRHKIDNTKTTVIRPAACLPDSFETGQDEISALRRKYDIPEHYLLAYHCSGYNGFEFILQSYSKAKESLAGIYPLVVAGFNTQQYQIGSNNAALDRQRARAIHKVISSGLVYGKDYFILGEIEEQEIGPILAGAEATVLAHLLGDSVPNSAFESVAAYTPIVYPNVPQYTEWFGQTGPYSYYPQDVDSLSTVLIDLVSSGRQPEIIRKQAEILFKKSIKDVFESYASLFRSVLKPL